MNLWIEKAVLFDNNLGDCKDGSFNVYFNTAMTGNQNILVEDNELSKESKPDEGKVYTFDYELPVSMVAEDPAPYGAKKEE